MEEKKWHKAKKMFLDIIASLEKDERNAKLVGKAYYNLAIVNENLGEFDAMFRNAKKAHSYLDSKKSKEYFQKAKYRKNADEKLDQQMQKANQDNEQDNR